MNFDMEDHPLNPIQREQELAQCAEALNSPIPQIRSAAAKRLGELSCGTLILMNALNDENSYVRAAAAEALGFTAQSDPHPEVFDQLMSCIDDLSDRVCSAAISSLGRLNCTEAIDQITPFLQVENPYLISSAILSLGRLGAAQTADQIMPHLDHANTYIKSAAIRVMGILKHQPAGEKIVEIIQEERARLEQMNRPLIITCFQALTALEYLPVVPLLVEIAQNDVGLRGKAVSALIVLRAYETVDLVAPMLADPSTSLRSEIIQLMIDAEYRESLPLIRPLLKDPNLRIRRLALMAVKKMIDHPAVQDIRWMTQNETNPFIRCEAVETLVQLAGNESLPDLFILAGDTNSNVRMLAVQMLGKFTALPPEAVEKLKQIARDDGSEAIRLAADEVLQNKPAILPMDLFADQRAVSNTLMPDRLLADLQWVREDLIRWQESLNDLTTPQNYRDVIEIEEAIRILLRYLDMDRPYTER